MSMRLVRSRIIRVHCFDQRGHFKYKPPFKKLSHLPKMKIQLRTLLLVSSMISIAPTVIGIEQSTVKEIHDNEVLIANW